MLGLLEKFERLVACQNYAACITNSLKTTGGHKNFDFIDMAGLGLITYYNWVKTKDPYYRLKVNRICVSGDGWAFHWEHDRRKFRFIASLSKGSFEIEIVSGNVYRLFGYGGREHITDKESLQASYRTFIENDGEGSN